MERNRMRRVTVLDHPLVQHKLALLREEATGAKEFRELMKELSIMLAYEATRELPLEETAVNTPLATASAQKIAGKKLALLPILRAGLGMAEGILELIPAAKVGHIGMYRDNETLLPVEYYCKLPEDIDRRDVLVLEPLLATGGNAIAAIDTLKQVRARSVRLLSILAVPEGISAVHDKHPDVELLLCSIDERLNDRGYIVPGLGNTGSRLYGTR